MTEQKKQKSRAVTLLEETLRDVANGNSKSGSVTGTERMRAALALLALNAAQAASSKDGEHIAKIEFQIIVSLINGTGGLPKNKAWWENLAKLAGKLL